MYKPHAILKSGAIVVNFCSTQSFTFDDKTQLDGCSLSRVEQLFPDIRLTKATNYVGLSQDFPGTLTLSETANLNKDFLKSLNSLQNDPAINYILVTEQIGLVLLKMGMFNGKIRIPIAVDAKRYSAQFFRGYDFILAVTNRESYVIRLLSFMFNQLTKLTTVSDPPVPPGV